VWVNARNDMRIYARNYEVHRGQVGSEHDHTESCCKESSESDQSLGLVFINLTLILEWTRVDL
jgi:hypothetical protein